VKLLLDTHVFLWWDQRSPVLNRMAGDAIADPRNLVLVSAASIREIAIKRRLGKLAFEGSADTAIAANGFQRLPILPADAEAAGDLVPAIWCGITPTRSTGCLSRRRCRVV
jgi:PIN domain nuclease of toxin-antitoxin system